MPSCFFLTRSLDFWDLIKCTAECQGVSDLRFDDHSFYDLPHILHCFPGEAPVWRALEQKCTLQREWEQNSGTTQQKSRPENSGKSCVEFNTSLHSRTDRLPDTWPRRPVMAIFVKVRFYQVHCKVQCVLRFLAGRTPGAPLLILVCVVNELEIAWPPFFTDDKRRKN